MSEGTTLKVGARGNGPKRTDTWDDPRHTEPRPCIRAETHGQGDVASPVRSKRGPSVSTSEDPRDVYDKGVALQQG